MNTEFFTKPAKKARHRVFINLSSSRRNLHVVVPAFMGMACEVAEIWLPQWQHQLRLTTKVLYGYGMLSAANSAPSEHKPQQETHDVHKHGQKHHS